MPSNILNKRLIIRKINTCIEQLLKFKFCWLFSHVFPEILLPAYGLKLYYVSLHTPKFLSNQRTLSFSRKLVEGRCLMEATLKFEISCFITSNPHIRSQRRICWFRCQKYLCCKWLQLSVRLAIQALSRKKEINSSSYSKDIEDSKNIRWNGSWGKHIHYP